MTIKYHFSRTDKIIVSFLTYLWLLSTYHLVFKDNFPISDYMGSDFSYSLPSLIDNYYWFAKNGILSIPWFTPAFCGGQNNFADPNSLYYSIPQALVFLDINPINAIYTSILIFSSIAFWGMYSLCKDIFKLNSISCLTASAIFMFNDFFIYRMIVGHINFQGFALIPTFCYFIAKESSRKSQQLFYIVIASTIPAYWCYSGMGIIAVPCMISAIILLLILGIKENEKFKNAMLRCAIAVLIGISLSASKLIAIYSLMKLFPRTNYNLSGYNLLDLINIALHALFTNSIETAKLADAYIKNSSFVILPNEMAYSTSMLPICIFTLWLLHRLFSHSDTRKIQKRSTTQIWVIHICIITALISPLFYMYYSPTWNRLLKEIPIINSATSPQRWLLIYIAPIALVSGICVSSFKTKASFAIFLATLIYLPIHMNYDKKVDSFIKTYKMSEFIDDFNNAKAELSTHRVKFNIKSEPLLLSGRNYFTAKGLNLLNCYNPIYGYLMENLSLERINTGDPLKQIDSMHLNIRNPACVLFPNENNCTIWENFKLSQTESAIAFVNYRSFTFNTSFLQRFSNILSAITLYAVLVYIVSYLVIITYKLCDEKWVSFRR